MCTPHMPFPPRGGGRADIWRRIEALVRLGHSVMLLHQHETDGPLAPRSESFRQMDEILSARFSYEVPRSRTRTARQLANLRRVPWGVAKVLPPRLVLDELRRSVAQFAPEAVLLEGPWFGELGRQFAADHGSLLLYRSHNVEHTYRRRQARASSSLRNQVAWRLSTVGLAHYELSLMSDARLVLDISVDDMEFWRRSGVDNIRWLPPLPEGALSAPPTDRVTSDVLFVGGLRLPNNIAGVRWLVDDVLPIVRAQRPETVFTIVGASPDDALEAALASTPGVRTFYDVESVSPYLFGAQVLVNPVSIGSGVQLKVLDMLMTDAPVVAHLDGLRGLPEDCVAECHTAGSAAAFASAVLDQLERPQVDLARRSAVRAMFTLDSLQEALAQLTRG